MPKNKKKTQNKTKRTVSKNKISKSEKNIKIIEKAVATGFSEAKKLGAKILKKARSIK